MTTAFALLACGVVACAAVVAVAVAVGMRGPGGAP